MAKIAGSIPAEPTNRIYSISIIIQSRKKPLVEVNGKRFDVTMWVPEVSTTSRNTKRRSQEKRTLSGSGANEVRVPMQGTIIKVLVEVGDSVEAGDPICVLEAMKMENNILAEKAGQVKEVRVTTGDSVGNGDVIAIIEIGRASCRERV